MLVRPLWLGFLTVLLMPLDHVLPTFLVPILGVRSTTANFLGLLAFGGLLLRLMQDRKRLPWTPGLIVLGVFVLWNIIGISWAVIVGEAISRAIEWLLFMGMYAVFLDYLGLSQTLGT